MVKTSLAEGGVGWMLIKKCLEELPEKDQIKIVVFDGNKEMFYGWFEYTSKKGIAYLFKIELEYNPKEKRVHVQLILDGIKKEYSSIVQNVMNALKLYYENEYGTPISFLVEKTYRKKEVLFELLSLKK